VPEVREAGGGRQSDIARADDGNAHEQVILEASCPRAG
jgi:hypothetical protein